jgi:hypothetical protein
VVGTPIIEDPNIAKSSGVKASRPALDKMMKWTEGWFTDLVDMPEARVIYFQRSSKQPQSMYG